MSDFSSTINVHRAAGVTIERRDIPHRTDGGEKTGGSFPTVEITIRDREGNESLSLTLFGCEDKLIPVDLKL